MAEGSFWRMRAALIEASEKPLEVVNDIDIEDPRAGRGARAGESLRCLPLRSVPHQRHVPRDRADRARPRGRGHGRGDRRRVSPTLAVGDKVVLSPIAGVQQVLLVRARRVRLLRQHGAASRPGRAGRRSHAAVAQRVAGAARRRRRRLRRVRDHARVRRDQGGRRHAARDRVRDRLRGADRRRRGAQHREGSRRCDRARRRRRRDRHRDHAGRAHRRCDEHHPVRSGCGAARGGCAVRCDRRDRSHGGERHGARAGDHERDRGRLRVRRGGCERRDRDHACGRRATAARRCSSARADSIRR